MNIKLKNINGEEAYKELKNIPNKCPICHHAVSPIARGGGILSFNEYDVSFHCINCKHIFIATYENGYIKNLAPIVPQKASFPDEINDISPLFIETYNQALYAESKSLNQLTGIGLRKSLEFLIKDFLTHQDSGREENIKSSTLSQCINNFIDNHDLVEISKRATWLGNDETHYVRKWEDKDIKDLKILTQLTVNWIHNILSSFTTL